MRNAASAQDAEPLLCLQVLGWNLGGAPLEDLQSAVLESTGSSHKDRVALLQECPRRKLGWTSTSVQGWRVVEHRSEGQWRGTGICFHPEVWSVVARKSARKGIWVRMKHLPTGLEVLVGEFAPAAWAYAG